jgi:hypothetical protein
MTTTGRRDLATRSTRGRGCGGEQAAPRSRDPSAPVVRRSVANLGFEFMVCRSKNILYNSINAFYQLGNNCTCINAYNILVLVGIAGYAVAPLYKYMWTYLAVDPIHT